MRNIALVFMLLSVSFFSDGIPQRSPQRGRPSRPGLPERWIAAFHDGLPFQRMKAAFSQDHILVKFRPRLSIQQADAIFKAYRMVLAKKIPEIPIYLGRLPRGISVQEALSALRENPDVAFAEPDYKMYITDLPDDPLFPYQYALLNTGQVIPTGSYPQGIPGADIKAVPAWDITRGNEKTIIAVIDTGVDLRHPDLRAKLASSGLDLIHGCIGAEDDHGHGTFVAGIVAAQTDNGEGIAGVARDCKILPIKAIGKNGEGWYSDVIHALVWAVNNGARVINLSVGGPGPSHALEEALRYVHEADCVITAATGNRRGPVVYPAAYDAYCLAVAATDFQDVRASWSNFGPEVDVAAPGVKVLGCIPTWMEEAGDSPYAYGSGTSYATPHVAGLAALIRSAKPDLSADAVMDIIRFAADDVNGDQHPGPDPYIGYGRLNMEKALVPILIHDVMTAHGRKIFAKPRGVSGGLPRLGHPQK